MKVDQKYVSNTVKDIIQKSNFKIQVNNKAFGEILKLEKQKKKYGRGIGKFLDLQDNKKNANKPTTIFECMKDYENAKKQNAENFTSKDIVDKVKNENFQNSVYINYLGKCKIWKPDKLFSNSPRRNILNL